MIRSRHETSGEYGPSGTSEPRLSAASADRYELALMEACPIDQQRDDLKTLRDRSTAMLGTAGLAASFIGGLPLRYEESSLSIWTYTGAIASVLLTTVTAAMAYPRACVFSQDALVIVEWIERYEANRTQMTRDLALHLRNNIVRTAMPWPG